MGVISGFGGAVNGAESVRNWSITETADTQAVVASNTKGGTTRGPGNTDWSGSYSAYGHTPDVMPGEVFTFAGNMNNGKGATGTAIVDEVSLTINIETGAIIEHSVNFSANGALTFGTVAATDASVPCPPTSIGCKVQLATPAGSPSFADLEDVRTVTLTLTRANAAYVNSETSGGTRRTKGNLDFTLAITVHTDDANDLPDVNLVRSVRIFVNATEYWELNWVRFSEISGVEVDIEGAGIVGATLNASMQGFTSISDVCTEGSIITPDEVTIWPENES
jgi:hypothetical protein